MINPDGVIGALQSQRINLKLEQKRLKALASQQLPGDMTNASELRKVSLVRLEQECQKEVDANVFHISGPRLQLLSQEELIDGQGNRSDPAFTEISTER